MKSVRHTSRDVKLRSEASARFERGVDPEIVPEALARATQLILELCPGARISAYADVYPNPVKARELAMPMAKFDRLLGVALGQDAILEALERLEFEPEVFDDLLSVQIPSYRRDVSLPQDIIEEAARIVGYDTLPSTLPVGQTPPVERDEMYLLRRAVRSILASAGVSEAVTYVTQSLAHAR